MILPHAPPCPLTCISRLPLPCRRASGPKLRGRGQRLPRRRPGSRRGGEEGGRVLRMGGSRGGWVGCWGWWHNLVEGKPCGAAWPPGVWGKRGRARFRCGRHQRWAALWVDLSLTGLGYRERRVRQSSPGCPCRHNRPLLLQFRAVSGLITLPLRGYPPPGPRRAGPRAGPPVLHGVRHRR